MKVIEMLGDRIDEEIGDACFYAKKALELKEQYPDLSRTLNSIAVQEMDHMTDLHNAVVNIINNYRRDNGEPPAEMQAVYDYLHKKQIEKAADARRYIDMYKK